MTYSALTLYHGISVLSIYIIVLTLWAIKERSKHHSRVLPSLLGKRLLHFWLAVELGCHVQWNYDLVIVCI